MAKDTTTRSAANAAEEGALDAVAGAVNRFGSFTNDFGSIAAGAVGTAAVDVSGDGNNLETGDEVVVMMEDHQSDGLVLASAEVTAADEITVRVLNTTSGGIDPAAITFFYFAPLQVEFRETGTPRYTG